MLEGAKALAAGEEPAEGKPANEAEASSETDYAISEALNLLKGLAILRPTST